MGNRRDTQRWAVEATWLVTHHHLHETTHGAIAYTAGALAHQLRGDHTEAARELENVRRLRPRLRAAPWLNADLALRCAALRSASTSATLPAPWNARRLRATHYRDTPMPERFPPACSVSKGGSGQDKDYGLTPAELRLVAFLPTHLSLQEIAHRLYLARPTVKTHVASIYDKLGVPGRSEAVEIIEQAGLGSTQAEVTAPDPDLD